MSTRPEFGLVIVGDEILSGKRSDKHMPKLIELLAARGLPLTAQPLARLSAAPENSRWDREPEQAREEADGLNNRKRSADRRPRPDRP